MIGLPECATTYVIGETIFIGVAFTRDVQVTGAPELSLQVGSQERRANQVPLFRAAALLPPSSGFHNPGGGDDWIAFEYVVQESDVDDDGVSVPANAIRTAALRPRRNRAVQASTRAPGCR